MSEKSDNFVRMLNLIESRDPEDAHELADRLLLLYLDSDADGREVADAYRALKARCLWWAYA